MEHNILAGVVVAILVILGTQLLKRSNAVLSLAKQTRVHLYEQPSKFRRFLSTPIETTQRTATVMEELDRVLGGGLVNGSVILLGGDPGNRKVHVAFASCL